MSQITNQTNDEDTNKNLVPNTTINSQQCNACEANNEPKPYKHYPLEPAMFLVFFAFSVSGTVLQSQIIFQTCTTHFGYNVSDCIQLGKPNASQETEVKTLCDFK